jgi:hypothetical protein
MCKRLILAVLFAAGLALISSPANADTLHGYCVSLTCSDNGAITPVSSTSFTFGFYADPSPQTGDDLLVFLSPVDLGSSISVGTSGGTMSATLFSATLFTSGQLDDYLGLNASPTNPFGNYGGSTGLDPGITGFYVYTLDLGTQTLNGQGGSNPEFSVSGLPVGTFILDFLTLPDDGGTIATPNSAALEAVPEPSAFSMLGFGLGLLGLAAFGRRRVLN